MLSRLLALCGIVLSLTGYLTLLAINTPPASIAHGSSFDTGPAQVLLLGVAIVLMAVGISQLPTD